MKKKYIKPMILVESFSLSSNIAGDCEVKIDTKSEGDCSYVDVSDRHSQVIFVDGVTACTTTASSASDGLCYHTPYESYNLFNS